MPYPVNLCVLCIKGFRPQLPKSLPSTSSNPLTKRI
jgi:hypothetical protein